MDMSNRVSEELSEEVLDYARDAGEESDDFENAKAAFGAYQSLSGSAAGYLALQLIKQVIEKLPPGEGVFGISNFTVDVDNLNDRWHIYRFTNSAGETYKALHWPSGQDRPTEMHQCFFYDGDEAPDYDFHFNSIVQSSVYIEPDGTIGFHYGNDPSAFERLMNVCDFFRPLLQPLINEAVIAGEPYYPEILAETDPAFKVIAADGGIPGERFRNLVGEYLIARFEALSEVVDERFEEAYGRLQEAGFAWGGQGLSSPTEDAFFAIGEPGDLRRAIVIAPEAGGGRIRMISLVGSGNGASKIEVHRLPGDASACEAAVAAYSGGARIDGRLLSYDPKAKTLDLADRGFNGQGQYQSILLNDLEAAAEAIRGHHQNAAGRPR
jgi:hypothetical protein